MKQYLQQQQLVSMHELNSRFGIEPEVIRCMLQVLITKGQVSSRLRTGKCGSQCAKCPVETTEMYQWVSKN